MDSFFRVEPVGGVDAEGIGCKTGVKKMHTVESYFKSDTAI